MGQLMEVVTPPAVTGRLVLMQSLAAAAPVAMVVTAAKVLLRLMVPAEP
jgi:hypothetical protein